MLQSCLSLKFSHLLKREKYVVAVGGIEMCTWGAKTTIGISNGRKRKNGISIEGSKSFTNWPTNRKAFASLPNGIEFVLVLTKVQLHGQPGFLYKFLRNF